MGADLLQSVRHVIAFCRSRQVLFRVLRCDIAFFLKTCKGQKPPARTPPEACFIL